MRRAVAGAAVSSEEGCSSTGAVERGGAAAGTGEGAGIALGHKSKTGYLGVRRNQRSGLTGIRPYLPGAGVARWQEREPGCIC